jgi:hypothetical protein
MPLRLPDTDVLGGRRLVIAFVLVGRYGFDKIGPKTVTSHFVAIAFYLGNIAAAGLYIMPDAGVGVRGAVVIFGEPPV